MRTAAIKLKNVVSLAHELPTSTRAQLLNIAIASLAMLAVVYVFILGVMVVNIIERKGLEAHAKTLAAEVRDFEDQYLATTSKVDINFSQSMGFREIKATYASRKALGSIMAKNNEI